jgi:hypothetical protein
LPEQLVKRTLAHSSGEGDRDVSEWPDSLLFLAIQIITLQLQFLKKRPAIPVRVARAPVRRLSPPRGSPWPRW